MSKKTNTIVSSLAMIITQGCAGTMPTNIGVHEGKLTPCPESPNCVSSYADTTDKQHFIRPLSYQGVSSDAHKRLLKIIQVTPRTVVIINNHNYIHATYKSALMRYVDDVEFYLPAEEQVIHMRSASRLGHSDLGANRQRIDFLRASFNLTNDLNLDLKE